MNESVSFARMVRSTLEPMLLQAQFALTLIENDDVVIYDRNPEGIEDIYRIIFNSAENSLELNIELGEFHWIRVYVLSKKHYPRSLGDFVQRRQFLVPNNPQLKEGWLYTTREQLIDSLDEIAEHIHGVLLHDGENIP